MRRIPDFIGKYGAVLFLCLFCLLYGAASAIAREVPAYHGYVNDYAHMLSPQAERKLERALQSFDLSDSTQVAILTIDSLEGDPLEDFSIRTVDKWKIGQKGKDNGVLLLVVKNDHKIRIEVGRGLEGVLTDLLAGRIVDQIITPRFKAGQFDAGFEAGVGAIIDATRGEFKADRYSRRTKGRKGPPRVFTYVFLALFFMAMLGSGSKVRGMVSGAIFLPIAVLMGTSSSMSGLLLLLLVVAGAAGGLLLPILLARLLSGVDHGSGRRGGGYYGGGFGGGGGFSGGGFGGFGGGGFGGGGASGGW